MEEDALILDDLYKHYPGAETVAVQGLSFRFRKGVIAGLLGPNGAGKTTTISIICGLVQQDSGKAVVLGMDTRHDLLALKKKIGVVTQQIALYPQLTVQENLAYIGRLYQIPAATLKQRIGTLLDRFGLSANAHKRIHNFSGGMKRRANIIAALLHEPELLVLDEPTAGVDVQSRTMILDFLQAYNQEGHSILYTSHLLEEAERICHEVAIIDEGRLLAMDSPEALVSQLAGCNNLEEVFLHYTGRRVRE